MTTAWRIVRAWPARLLDNGRLEPLPGLNEELAARLAKDVTLLAAEMQPIHLQDAAEALASTTDAGEQRRILLHGTPEPQGLRHRDHVYAEMKLKDNLQGFTHDFCFISDTLGYAQHWLVTWAEHDLGD